MNPDDVRQEWAERSGKFSPDYYAELGPNVISETLVDVFDHYADENARILEVGCGSGRHLAQLLDHGYENLTGIDINEASFDVMADHYPRLAGTGTFHTGALEDHVTDFDDDEFDVIYSVETLQHIHPENTWVFEELTRISGDLLITAENEGNGPTRGRGDDPVNYVDDEFPLYYRNWKQVFGDLGAAQLLCHPTNRDTIRVFRVL